MRYRLFNRTAQNIEPKSYRHWDEVVNACHAAMRDSTDEFTVLNEREE